MTLMSEVIALTDVGKKRRNAPNQDSVGIILPGFFQRRPPLLILADGMGGRSGGQVASQLVICAFKQQYIRSRLGKSALPFLKYAVVAAHKDVVATAKKNPELSEMGSTVVAAVLYKDHVDLVNVGDSRAYVLREGRLVKISEDQSVVADKIRQGTLSIKDALNDPRLNQLTMSISAKRITVDPNFYSSKLGYGDVIILCSDGLWGVLPEPLIESIVANFPPKEAATKLINLTNDAGGKDNISIIIATSKKQ